MSKLTALDFRKAFIEAQDRNSSFLKEFKINDSFNAFATNALERIDMRLNKPKYKYFWAQEMPVMLGGGALESMSYLRQQFSNPDVSKILASGTTNQVYMVNDRLEKINTPIIPIILGAEVGLIDSMKYNQLGYDIWGAKVEAVNRSYNEALDEIAFHGHVVDGTAYKGLYNNDYHKTTNPNGFKRTSATKLFKNLSVTEIINELGAEIIGIIKDLEYEVDSSIAPNHISIPIDLFMDWATPSTIGTVTGDDSVGVVTSKLEYVQNQINKFLAVYGTSATFYPSRFLAEGQADDGANDKGRMVISCHDQNIFRMPIAMPLTQGATINLGVQGTNTAFVAFVGVPQFIWTKAIRYFDSGTA